MQPSCERAPTESRRARWQATQRLVRLRDDDPPLGTGQVMWRPMNGDRYERYCHDDSSLFNNRSALDETGFGFSSYGEAHLCMYLSRVRYRVRAEAALTTPHSCATGIDAMPVAEVAIELMEASLHHKVTISRRPVSVCSCVLHLLPVTSALLTRLVSRLVSCHSTEASKIGPRIALTERMRLHFCIVSTNLV